MLSGTGIYRYGDEPLRHPGFADNTNADVVECPDSGRVRTDVGPTGHHRETVTFKRGGRPFSLGFQDGEKID